MVERRQGADLLLDVVGDARLVIGLDLGEQQFVGALVNLRGEIRNVVAAPVVGRDGAERLAILQPLVDTLEAGGKDQSSGLGRDARSRRHRTGNDLGGQHLWVAGPPARRALRDERTCRRTSRTTRVPWRWASTFERSDAGGDLVVIEVGLGIGAGIIINGGCSRATVRAGEIGHTTVTEPSAPCRCGRYGCLETVASSGRSSVRRRPRRGSDRLTTRSAAREAGHLTIADVKAAVRDGDEPAGNVIMEAARPLGDAIAGSSAC